MTVDLVGFIYGLSCLVGVVDKESDFVINDDLSGRAEIHSDYRYARCHRLGYYQTESFWYRMEMQERMTACGSHIRPSEQVEQAVLDAQALLVDIGFDGRADKYLRPKDGQLYRDANTLAFTLDEYNNGALCSP